MPLDPELGEYETSSEEESTPLLFPTLRPIINYKDPHRYGTSSSSFDKSEAAFYDSDRKGNPFGSFYFKSPFRGSVIFKQIGGLNKPCRRYLGILLAIFASFLLSLTTLIARVLIEYHPFNEALWRFFGIFLPSLPILFWEYFGKKEPVFQTIYPCWELGKLKTLGVIFVRRNQLI